MLIERVIFCLIYFQWLNSEVQINVYLTNWKHEDENIPHDCLRVLTSMKKESDSYQLISYCMSVWPSKFQIKENHLDQKFTFDQLFKANITNEQLYLWSAPIDLIEEYQFYLNELTNSGKSLLSEMIYYNCTYPYFGSQCQYILNINQGDYLSLDEMISDYYYFNRYEPTLFTCYIHIPCNRGPSPSCLDWSEICDGKIDCLDEGYDEEYCGQIDLHQCNEKEFQCSNGQCISAEFFQDGSDVSDCLDQSDEMIKYTIDSSDQTKSFSGEPTFRFEDILCARIFHEKYSAMTFLTSSCLRYRSGLLAQSITSIKPNLISNECWTVMKCIIQMPISADFICLELCFYKVCDEIARKTCPDLIYLPALPLLYGHIYLAYEKNESIFNRVRLPKPTYVCYNDQRLYVPDDNKTFLLSNNHTCRLYKDSQISSSANYYKWIETDVSHLFRWLEKKTISISKASAYLNTSIMYKCLNSSKYISKSRLFDGNDDCYYADDEDIELFNKTCSTEEDEDRNSFKCQRTNECIPHHLVDDGICHCTISDSYCDDEQSALSYIANTISFQILCDKHLNLLPDQNETDETNCEQWPIIHIYNRCNGLWDILDGSDEINCYSLPLFNCSINHHICISFKTNQLICLPLEKANDGIIDCLGAADEPTLCQNNIEPLYPTTFYCKQENYHPCVAAREICDNYQVCDNKEDELICPTDDMLELSRSNGICMHNYESKSSDIIKILCRRFIPNNYQSVIYFTLDQSQNFIPFNIKDEISHNQNIQSYQPRCHRGLDLQIWLDKENNLQNHLCLCPPSYYGEICQYQNERISLTLQFSVTSDSVKTPYLIIISLMDNSNERIIHSNEQLTYLSVKHCQRKFNIYLLYSNRPKDLMKSYFIHIDIYDRLTFNYRLSVIQSLDFPFLPVHRLAVRIDIPGIRHTIESCSSQKCINGKCIKYFHDPANRTFCQCYFGWSGRYCTIKHHCMCSSDSLCLGKLSNNRSLCLCPLNKMGLRCLIDDKICQNSRCFNGGQCISLNEYEKSRKKFECICLEGYFGERCELIRTKLILSLDQNLTLSSSIHIHFIEVKMTDTPVRTTTFKRNLLEENNITIYWSLPFHLAFLELSDQRYYLIVMQKLPRQGIIIEKRIDSSQQCLPIKEIFNQTIANFSLLRRMKFYHLPCQINSSQLACFYDERQLCLCQELDQQRVANCFQFDHSMKFYCFGQNGCENGGECFQEHSPCPRISICKCPLCYSGARCQFNTNGHSLSLDAILGYHILSNRTISHQPMAVLISLILSLIITLFGLTNGILSLITFKNTVTRECGCGIYLFTSSIITLLIMLIYLLKFFILLFSQMGSISNELFLKIQCYSIDFLLRCCLTMDQWLTAFVAIERAFVIMKGVNFKKNKSKSTAKWMIIILVFLTMVTNIFDPIYRSLFEENEDDEKRVWCIVNYPSVIRTINLIITICHFIFPFLINFISAIVIIIISTRQRAVIKKQQKYKEILNEQIKQHQNLLIGPSVLFLLGIPRLIISFASGCMKSSSDSWLFLLGYFISLIPPTLTFILFVLPSTTYKQAFRKAISHYRNILIRA